MFLEAAPGTTFTTKIDVVELMGAETILYTTINQQNLIARIDSRTDIKNGQNMTLALDMNKAHFFDHETEVRIR